MIETWPRLDDGTPFPTRYWLTCRRLSAAIGTLESSGWMALVNQRLAEDETMRAGLVVSIERYVSEREAIDPLGVAGHPGGGPDRVKCLHAHVAHHLITGDNPVGEAALSEIGWTEPKEPCA